MTAGCDLDFLFIEPASGGEARLFTVPREGGQGADPERLVSLGGGMDRVRYRVTEHHQPFLLSGDLSEGVRDLVALQLPVLSGDPVEQTLEELPMASRWQSLRVYDGGTCGVLVPWANEDEGGASVPAFAPLLYQSLANQLEASSKVSDVTLVNASLQPVLRSEMPPNPVVSPRPRDRLELAFELHAGHIGRDDEGPIGCEDVRMGVATTLEFVPTDFAWVDVRKKGFPKACFGESMSHEELREAIASGRRCDPDGTLSLPEPYGEVRGSDVGALEWLADFTGGPERRVLVGLTSLDGQPLGAHDVLMRTVASEVTSFSGRRCTEGMQQRIRREVLQALAKGFVTSLSAAFRDALTWDPRLVGFPDHAAFACETDRDCRFAYDGVGLRHRCMRRSPDRYPEEFRAFLRPASLDYRVCHFVSEPDRINVRPDGIQIAITGEDDAEATQYMSGPVSTFCDNHVGLNGAIPPGRDPGTRREILPPPRLHTLAAPFTVPEVVAEPQGGVAGGAGCSAASGRPTGLLGLLLVAALRRRRRG